MRQQLRISLGAKMQLDNIKVIDKTAAENMFASGGEKKICEALVSLAFHEQDWQWVQDCCLRFLHSDNPRIAGASATCLGHIARIHRELDKDKVLRALRQKLGNSEIAGVVEDAVDDIAMFVRERDVDWE